MKTRNAITAIKKALESANVGMFWDIIIDKDDIKERFDSQPEYYTAQEKAESVISSIIMSHEQTLVDASREQCHRAEKDALKEFAAIRAGAVAWGKLKHESGSDVVGYLEVKE